MKSKTDKAIKVAILCVFFCSITPLFVYADNSRIYYNNQDLFLSGANLAWQQFANDIGPNPSTPNTAHFDNVFGQFHANGGNVMRLWLHTTGANSPAWSGFTVTGPGTNTIADLNTILDLAWEHEVSVMCCLWSFDMLRKSNGPTINNRANAILTNDPCTQSYIDNCLIPMVTALQGHPAIVAWEIFNEPEGMSDEFGWPDINHVPMANIQRFVNKCAGAIHRTDPTVMVTNGCWDMQAGTDVDGHTNYYRDDRLIAAGGDADGTLDFYCIHYYDGDGAAHSPFLRPASYWGLDKPLVIAEFFPPPACTNCGSTPFETLYSTGYAGALTWSWTDSDHASMLGQMAAMWAAHKEDVDIVIGAEPNIPAVPTGLSATPGNSTVSLDWNDNSESDLAGYNVYRSTTSGSGYIMLNSTPVVDSNYIDNGASGGWTYYYVVTAEDTSYHESNDSSEVFATPTDTIPPSVPTGLVAAAGNQTISLNWNDNNESDLAGYNVYCSTTSGGGYVKRNGSLLSSSDYVDNSVNNGTTYYYVVTAVDTLSNESGISSEVSATPYIIADVNILGSWVLGTSHARETGINRALVFIAHVEHSASTSLTGVTYGGQQMTKVIDMIVYNIYYSYVAAYILNEAGVAAATSGTFNPTWSGTPNTVGYASVFLGNVNQTTLVGASDSNATASSTPNPIKTNPLSTTQGDKVIVAASSGNSGSYTLNNGFTEGIDQTMGSAATGVTGHKAATGVAETPSATFSPSLNRQVIIGFVVQVPGPPDMPPSAPTGLSASASIGTVLLEWNDNAETDVNGYNVYRSLTSGSGYNKENPQLLSNSNYNDTNVVNGTPYYYVVTAVDDNDHESGYSDEDSGTPVSAAGGTGSALREWWTGITGTAVSDLTSDANYPDNTSGEELIFALEGPVNWADNYGTRIRGYLNPVTTGSYRFWVASDANSELWLSTSNNPESSVLIAYVMGSPQSSLISLVAGQKYYIEVLHKEGTGDDNISVSWEGPGISQQVIDGLYLSPCCLEFRNFADFAAQWNQTGCDAGNNWCSGFDFDRDGSVLIDDLKTFAQLWLLPPISTE
jgi:fibronectin type 3 domain-containing protein